MLFECTQGFGGFIRGKNVVVGDYPERDIMDDEEETADVNENVEEEEEEGEM